MLFRDRTNASSSNVKDDDDTVEDYDEGADDTRNEPPKQRLPQRPNNSRSRNTCVYRCDSTLERVANSNQNVTKAQSIRMLGVKIYFSSREVRVKQRMIAIKYHPDEWRERYVFTKEDGMETIKGASNAFDFLK